MRGTGTQIATLFFHVLIQAFGLGLLAPPLLLNQDAIRVLAVIPADVRLNQMRGLELRAVRAISKRVGIVRVRRIAGSFSLAGLRPGAERRIVVETKVFERAAEFIRKLRKFLFEESAEASTRKTDDSDHVTRIAARSVTIDHVIDTRLFELAKSDAAFNFDGDRGAIELCHQNNVS